MYGLARRRYKQPRTLAVVKPRPERVHVRDSRLWSRLHPPPRVDARVRGLESARTLRGEQFWATR